eukprot:463574-Amphidinium_carterae.1
MRIEGRVRSMTCHRSGSTGTQPIEVKTAEVHVFNGCKAHALFVQIAHLAGNRLPLESMADIRCTSLASCCARSGIENDLIGHM